LIYSISSRDKSKQFAEENVNVAIRNAVRAEVESVAKNA